MVPTLATHLNLQLVALIYLALTDSQPCLGVPGHQRVGQSLCIFRCSFINKACRNSCWMIELLQWVASSKFSNSTLGRDRFRKISSKQLSASQASWLPACYDRTHTTESSRLSQPQCLTGIQKQGQMAKWECLSKAPNPQQLSGSSCSCPTVTINGCAHLQHTQG